MKARKIIILLVLIAIPVLALVFRADLYRSFVSYRMMTLTTVAPLENEKGMEKVTAETQSLGNDALALGQACLELTTAQLDMELKVLPTDPNALVEATVANPMGYATYCASMCNYAFAQNGLQDIWMARTAQCNLYFLGIDLVKYVDNENYKGHDIVVLENKESGERIGIDPTAYEYLKIGQVRL